MNEAGINALAFALANESFTWTQERWDTAFGQDHLRKLGYIKRARQLIEIYEQGSQ
jgi:hypothetical protein